VRIILRLPDGRPQPLRSLLGCMRSRPGLFQRIVCGRVRRLHGQLLGSVRRPRFLPRSLRSMQRDLPHCGHMPEFDVPMSSGAQPLRAVMRGDCVGSFALRVVRDELPSGRVLLARGVYLCVCSRVHGVQWRLRGSAGEPGELRGLWHRVQRSAFVCERPVRVSLGRHGLR